MALRVASWLVQGGCPGPRRWSHTVGGRFIHVVSAAVAGQGQAASKGVLTRAILPTMPSPLPDCFHEELELHRATPPTDLRSQQRPRKPAKRCYELAGQYFLDHGEREGVRLVHGLVDIGLEGINGRMMHAWVEVGDLVYDRGKFFTLSGYRAVMRPQAVKTFTAVKVFAKLIRKGGGGLGWGPCPELEDAHLRYAHGLPRS